MNFEYFNCTGCTNEAFHQLHWTHKKLSSLNLSVHCHRERQATPTCVTWTRKHLSPTQVVPFPLYPAMHAQWKYPTVLLQTADGSQLCTFVVHSSISKRNKKIAGAKKKKKRLKRLRYKWLSRKKCTHSVAKTVQLKQTSSAIKLQTREFSLVLLLVAIYEMWRR